VNGLCLFEFDTVELPSCRFDQTVVTTTLLRDMRAVLSSS
jgi:hypothetical protein